MEFQQTLYLFLGLLSLANVGIWMTVRAIWSRTDENKRIIDHKIDTQGEIMSQRLDAQYQALHDRLSVHGSRFHKFELHVAENYVKNEHLEKALSKTEAALVKEVHSVKDQMEQTNLHIAQLSQMLQAMAVARSNEIQESKP